MKKCAKYSFFAHARIFFVREVAIKIQVTSLGIRKRYRHDQKHRRKTKKSFKNSKIQKIRKYQKVLIEDQFELLRQCYWSFSELPLKAAIDTLKPATSFKESWSIPPSQEI